MPINLDNVVQPNQGGPTGSPNLDLGALASGILGLINKPRELVQGQVGNFMPGEGSGNERFNAAVAETARQWQGIHVPEVPAAVALAGPLGLAIKAAESGLNNMSTLGPMAVDQGTDPLNLVGFGLPGKGAAAVRAAATPGAMAPEALARALEAAQWIESAPGKAFAETLRRGGQAGSAVLGSNVTGPIARGLAGRRPMWQTEEIPDLVRQTPQGQAPLSQLADTELTPENLLQWLQGTSAQSKVHARDEALTNTGRLMKEMGHNFEDVLSEMGNAKSMFLPPVETPRGGIQAFDFPPNIQRLQGLEDDAWRSMQNMADPRAKLAGIEILGQVQESAVRMWQDKLIELEKAGIGQLQANAAHAAWDSFYREAYHDLQRIYTAGGRAMRRAEQEVGQLPKLDPATERQYAQLWDYSHQMMENFRSNNPVMGLFPQPQAPMTLWGERLPGMQQQAADMLQQAVIPQRSNLEHAIGGVRDTITGLPAAMKEQLLDPGTANSLFTQGLEQTKMLELGLPAALADLPVHNRNVLMQHLDDLQKQANVILGPTPVAGALGGGIKGKFEKTLKTIFEAQTGTPYVPKQLGADTIEHFNQTIRAMNPAMDARLTRMFGPEGIQTGNDFTKFARSLVPDSTVNSLRKDLLKYPGGDLLSADLFGLVKDRVVRGYAEGLGVRSDTNPITRAIAQEMNLWKESALFAPAYHGANTLGGLFMQGLEHVDPVRTVGSLKENIGKILMGGPETDITPGHIQALMDRLEMQIPAGATGAGAAGLRDETYTLAREMAQQGIPASQRIGGPAMAMRGGVFGAATGQLSAPEDATWQERAASIGAGAAGGAALGGAFGKLSAKNMDIGRGIEDVLRKETFAEGVRRSLPGLRPELTRIVDDALNVGAQFIHSTGTGRVITPIPTMPGTRKAIHDIIEHEQGILGPSMLEGLLRRGGVSQEVAKLASDEWRDALILAQKNGLELSHMVNFDYKDLTNAQQMVRDYIPFSTWAMKAMPFFGRHLAEHPWLPLKIAQLENASNQQRERKGLPARFAGAVETPIADEAWSKILGQDVKTSYNPLRGLLPFSDIGRNAQAKPDESPIETALRVGQVIGLPGLGPIPEMALRMTGMMGDEEPSRGLIRQAAPIQAITGAMGLNRGAGLDFNKPIVAAQDAIRRAVGQHPIDLEKRAILNRLDELAYQRTGFTTNQSEHPEIQPFVTAKLNEKGPLWDEARRDTLSMRSRMGTGNFMLQAATPQAVLGREEEAFRGARANTIPQDTQRLFAEIGARAVKDPQGDASQYATPLRTIAVQLSKPLYDQGVLQDGEISPRLERLLAAPTATNINEVRQSIQKELSARNPLMGGYGQSGNNEEARLKVLLEAYNNVPALIKQDPSLAGLSPAQIEQLTAMSKQVETMNPQVLTMLRQGKDPLAQQLKGLQARKDTFRKQPGNEMLDKYLNYMAATRGTGTMDGFFEQLTAGK